MDNVGYAALQVIPSFKGIDKNLERGLNGPMLAAGAKGGTQFGDEAGKTAGRRFGGVFSAAAKLSLVGLAGAGALAFKLGADSVQLASDLNESLNAVTVTYGKQAKAVKVLGTEAADSLGLSNEQFNGLAVQFSAFATQIAGGEGPKVVGVLDELTTRGADFASVMNLEVNEAMGLFQSGLAGETEPLRKFGIDLSAAAVTAHAYKTGIADVGDELTEGEKVQARYSLLMKSTAKTQGDFANTSDSLANRQRILNARWDDARAKLGSALLPALEDFTGFLLDEGIPAFEKASAWLVEDFGPGVKNLAGDLKPAAKAVGEFVGFLNDLPSEAKLATLASVFAGGAALKIRGGGGGGALGTAGRALGLAKPVPVFVTNPGFGGTSGAGGKGGKTPLGTKVLGGAAVAGGSTAAAGVAAAGIMALFEKFAPDSPIKGSSMSSGGGFQTTPDTTLDDLSDPFGIKSEPKFEPGAFNAGLIKMKNSIELAVAESKESFEQLPKEIKTDFRTNGVPESKREALDLVKKYDLTPREKRTLFKTLGIDASRSSTQQLIEVLRNVPGNKNTQFSQTGGQSVIDMANSIANAINNMPLLPNVNLGGAGRSGGGASRSAPRRPRRTPSRSEALTGELGRMMDERYQAQRGLENERRGAFR